MIVQYRIKNVGGKCYPQVRMKEFIGWGKWYRIAKHNDGWGLYDLDFSPMDAYDCETVISQYHIDNRHTSFSYLFPNR